MLQPRYKSFTKKEPKKMTTDIAESGLFVTASPSAAYSAISTLILINFCFCFFLIEGSAAGPVNPRALVMSFCWAF